MKALLTLAEALRIWGSIGPGPKYLTNLMNANGFPSKLDFLAQKPPHLITLTEYVIGYSFSAYSFLSV